jgi:hypothetical protein
MHGPGLFVRQPLCNTQPPESGLDRNFLKFVLSAQVIGFGGAGGAFL